MFSVMLCFFDLFCRFTRSFLVLAGDRDVTLKVLKRGSSISSNIAHLEVCWSLAHDWRLEGWILPPDHGTTFHWMVQCMPGMDQTPIATHMGDERPELVQLVAILTSEKTRGLLGSSWSFSHVLVVNSPSLSVSPDAGAHHIVMFSVKDDVTAEEFSTLESSLRNLKQILGAWADWWPFKFATNQPTKTGDVHFLVLTCFKAISRQLVLDTEQVESHFLLTEPQCLKSSSTCGLLKQIMATSAWGTPILEGTQTPASWSCDEPLAKANRRNSQHQRCGGCVQLGWVALDQMLNAVFVLRAPVCSSVFGTGMPPQENVFFLVDIRDSWCTRYLYSSRSATSTARAQIRCKLCRSGTAFRSWGVW